MVGSGDMTGEFCREFEAAEELTADAGAVVDF
jgi:hypothetical protein